MKASELRLGNYVKASRTGEIIPAYWLTIKHLEDGNIQAAGYDDSPVWEPIPLTEKWLLDFGFELKPYHTNTYLFDANNYFEIMPDGTILFEDEFAAVHIKYVHQLQNLYFALTGEELALDLAKQTDK